MEVDRYNNDNFDFGYLENKEVAYPDIESVKKISSKILLEKEEIATKPSPTLISRVAERTGSYLKGFALLVGTSSIGHQAFKTTLSSNAFREQSIKNFHKAVPDTGGKNIEEFLSVISDEVIDKILGSLSDYPAAQNFLKDQRPLLKGYVEGVLYSAIINLSVYGNEQISADQLLPHFLLRVASIVQVNSHDLNRLKSESKEGEILNWEVDHVPIEKDMKSAAEMLREEIFPKNSQIEQLPYVIQQVVLKGWIPKEKVGYDLSEGGLQNLVKQGIEKVLIEQANWYVETMTYNSNSIDLIYPELGGFIQQKAADKVVDYILDSVEKGTIPINTGRGKNFDNVIKSVVEKILLEQVDAEDQHINKETIEFIKEVIGHLINRLVVETLNPGSRQSEVDESLHQKLAEISNLLHQSFASLQIDDTNSHKKIDQLSQDLMETLISKESFEAILPPIVRGFGVYDSIISHVRNEYILPTFESYKKFQLEAKKLEEKPSEWGEFAENLGQVSTELIESNLESIAKSQELPPFLIESARKALSKNSPVRNLLESTVQGIVGAGLANTNEIELKKNLNLAVQAVRELFLEISQDKNFDEKELLQVSRFVIKVFIHEEVVKQIGPAYVSQFGLYDLIIENVNNYLTTPLFESYSQAMSIYHIFHSGREDRPVAWNQLEESLLTLSKESIDTLAPSIPELIEGNVKGLKLPSFLKMLIPELIIEEGEIRSTLHSTLETLIFNMTVQLSESTPKLETNKYFKKQLVLSAIRELASSKVKRIKDLSKKTFMDKDLFYSELADHVLKMVFPQGSAQLTLPFADALIPILKEQIKSQLLQKLGNLEDKNQRYQFVYSLILGKINKDKIKKNFKEDISSLDQKNQKKMLKEAVGEFLKQNTSNPFVGLVAKISAGSVSDFLIKLLERKDFELVLRKIVWNGVAIAQSGQDPVAKQAEGPRTEDFEKEVGKLFSSFDFLAYPIRKVMTPLVAKQLTAVENQSLIEIVNDNLKS